MAHGESITRSKATNRSLSDRLPRDYIGKLLREAERSGTLAAKLDQLQAACLPVEVDIEATLTKLEPINITLFLEQRANQILKRVSLVLGDSFEVSPAAVLPGEDDDEL